MTATRNDTAPGSALEPHGTLEPHGALAHVMDVDAHEWMPNHFWPEAFGETGARVQAIMGSFRKSAENTLYRPDLHGDTAEITEDTVWNLKGPEAPSAMDLRRRLAVMDVMGIDRQLVFPGFALAGLVLSYHPDPVAYLNLDTEKGGRFENFDSSAEGRAIIDAHNAWVVGAIKQVDGNRVRPVGIAPTDSLEDMLATARYLIDNGVRCIWLPGGAPPAGTSPADRALDPFWQLAAETNTAVTLHVGLEFGFLRSSAWGANVPEFVSSADSSLEFPIEPLRSATTMTYTADNFLSAMILGGVFERHPTLRFGILECAAYWVGGMAEKLDIVAEQFARRLANTLSMKPSEYLARNVRISPFSFEPVARYLEQYPVLRDVLAYSSDFPHREGGKESKRVIFDKIAHLGDDVVSKFFVDNGAWLLPD